MRPKRTLGVLRLFAALLFLSRAGVAAADDKPPWTEIAPARGVDATHWTERSPAGVPKRRAAPAAGEGQPDGGATPPAPRRGSAGAFDMDSDDGRRLPLVPPPGGDPGLKPKPPVRGRTRAYAGGGSRGKKLALIIGLSAAGAVVVGGAAAAAALLLTRSTTPALPGLVNVP